MAHPLDLTKANRLRLAQAFRHNPRVDYSIDCVIEGQLGKVFVDQTEQPAAFSINIGPFWYFAGEAGSPGGQAMLQEFPAFNLMMPSPPEWTAAAHQIFGAQLRSMQRYSFSSEHLSVDHLQTLLNASVHRDALVKIDESIAAPLLAMPEPYLEVSDFDSLSDFLARGVGFAVVAGNEIKGIAYSSLVCSRGIEVSLYVEEAYRRQGVATALGAQLVFYCLERGLRPNWDAANPESCRLATKLGFTPTGEYFAYYHR